MAYTLPKFNLLAKIWDCQVPSDGSADWSDVPCQKYIRSRMSLDVKPQTAASWWQTYTPPIQLRFPRSHLAFTPPPAEWEHAVIEVPQDSGQYYRCQWREVAHQGFVNEYAIILVTPCDADGLAIPPPLTDSPVGIAPDVCTSPPPPPEELQQAQFYIVDDSATGMVGVLARRQSESSYYEARYQAGDGTFYLIRMDSDTPTYLADYSLSVQPGVGDFVAIYFSITGDGLSARIYTPDEDHTISATDSTYPTGSGGGIHIEYLHRCSPFNYWNPPPGSPLIEDQFVDTPGTDLASHTMDSGSGWFYGSTGSVFEIAADGISCQVAAASSPVSWQIVMTDY